MGKGTRVGDCEERDEGEGTVEKGIMGKGTRGGDCGKRDEAGGLWAKG